MISTLHDLLHYDASRFTHGEIQLMNCLPHWIARADSGKLKAVLKNYLAAVELQVQKLDELFLEEKPGSISLRNQVIHAFIDETNGKLSLCADPEVRDACLLACVQMINHFKISNYGTAASFARELGMEKQARAFWEAEINEKKIDDRLSQLAEHEINPRAKSPLVVPGRTEPGLPG